MIEKINLFLKKFKGNLDKLLEIKREIDDVVILYKILPVLNSSVNEKDYSNYSTFLFRHYSNLNKNDCIGRKELWNDKGVSNINKWYNYRIQKLNKKVNKFFIICDKLNGKMEKIERKIDNIKENLTFIEYYSMKTYFIRKRKNMDYHLASATKFQDFILEIRKNELDLFVKLMIFNF